MIRYLVAICSLLTAASAAEGDAAEVPRELTTPNYRVSAITGIGAEAGVERQDPSNVIKLADTYYVWYTRRESRSSNSQAW